MRCAVLVLVGLCSSAGAVAAQATEHATATVDSGTVARVAWVDGRVATGRLLTSLRQRTDTVVYCPWPGPRCDGDGASAVLAMPDGGLARVERYAGSGAGRGALIGGAATALVLAVGLIVWDDSDSGSEWDAARVLEATTLVAAGAGVGALVGRRSHRWVEVPIR